MSLAKQIIPTVTPEYASRLNRRNNAEYQHLWSILDSVCDPELPTLTIWNLGILHDIKKLEDDTYCVEITLTYSGCPAVSTIIEDIETAFKESKITEKITVQVVLSPAWSTDMMSPQGRQQLRNLNIAPPEEEGALIHCPICQSENTEVISEFGSTACKALYQCKDCLEPFDYFKRF